MTLEPEESDYADRIEGDTLSAKSAKQMAGYIERIERLKEEQKAIGEDIKSVYGEAASCGVDKVALRQIVKDRAADSDKTLTLRTITETYRRALANLQGELGDWARVWRSSAAKQDYASPDIDAVLKGRRKRGGSADGVGRVVDL